MVLMSYHLTQIFNVAKQAKGGVSVCVWHEFYSPKTPFFFKLVLFLGSHTGTIKIKSTKIGWSSNGICSYYVSKIRQLMSILSMYTF